MANITCTSAQWPRRLEVRRAASTGITRITRPKTPPLLRTHLVAHRRRRRVLLPRLRRRPQLPPQDRPPPVRRARRPARAARRHRAGDRVRGLPRALGPRRPGAADHRPLLRDAPRRRAHRRPRRPRRRRHLLAHRRTDRRRRRTGRGVRGLHRRQPHQPHRRPRRRHRPLRHRRRGPCGAALAIELHEALDPLAPHLAAVGRESILLQGARIALADGGYIPAEREVLTTVGDALSLRPDDVARLMEEARAPF